MTDVKQSLKMILEGTYIDDAAQVLFTESQIEEIFAEATLYHSPAQAKGEIEKLKQIIKHTEEQRARINSDPRHAHERHLYKQTFDERIAKAEWHIKKLSGEAIQAHR